MKELCLVVGSSVALYGCSSGGDAGLVDPMSRVDASTASGSTPTYYHDVKPLLDQHCVGCHREGGIAPMVLTTFERAKAFAPQIVGVTHDGTMPPWGARNTAECTAPKPWQGDLRLADVDLATLKAWHDGGDTEGNVTMAGEDPGSNTDLPGALSLAPPPYTLTAQTDTFRCFVLDPKVTQTKFLDASFFKPGNTTIVHHAIAYAIPSGATPPGDEYECQGGPQVAGAALVAAWAPGGVPSIYPQGVALPIPSGMKFVVQVHYHPHADAKPDPDATTFFYRFTDVVPTYIVVPLLLGNFSDPVDSQSGIGLLPGPDDPTSAPVFAIPANAKGHTETMQFRVPATLQGFPIPELSIFSVGAHMHLAGVDEKITLNRAGGETSCLLQEPDWNFDWQRAYAYDAPLTDLPKIAPGDVLTMRCTYNNAMDNLHLREGLEEQGLSAPRDIRLGESTLDEMCIGAFAFLYKRP